LYDNQIVLNLNNARYVLAFQICPPVLWPVLSFSKTVLDKAWIL